MKMIVAFAALLLTTSGVEAQQLDLEAVIGPDGTLEIRPVETDDPNQHSLLQSPTPGDTGDNVYLWLDESGAFKGIFEDQQQVVAAPLQPGDTVQTFTNAGFSFFGWAAPTDQQIQEVVELVAQKLFAEAKTRGCNFTPLPTTVSPSVSMGVSFGVTGSVSLSATWSAEDLCG